MSPTVARLSFRFLLVLCVALAPCPGLAEATVDQAVDVALHEQGLLIGQYLTSEGEPREGREVRITLADGRTTVAKTDEHGAFAFRGATGAVRLTTTDAEQLARVWAPSTAPPNASNAVLLVPSDDVTRGQRQAGPHANNFARKSKRLLSNPIFIAGVAAAAIAIPVALANDDDPASP